MPNLLKKMPSSVETHEPKSITFLHQRISIAIRLGNAACLMGALQTLIDDTSMS
jgi:hypothetical protein